MITKKEPTAKTTLILLQGVLEMNWCCRFMTTYIPNQDQTRVDGQVCYSVLGYADDIADGQMQLYGRVCPLPKNM